MSRQDVINALREAYRKGSVTYMHDYVMGGMTYKDERGQFVTTKPCPYEDLAYILQNLNGMPYPEKGKQYILTAAIHRGDVKEGSAESKLLYGYVRDNADKFNDNWHDSDSRKVVRQNAGQALDDIQSGKIKSDSKFYGEVITTLSNCREKDERLKGDNGRDWLYNEALKSGQTAAVRNLIEDEIFKTDNAFIDKALRECTAKFGVDHCVDIYGIVASRSGNPELLGYVRDCMKQIKDINAVYGLAQNLARNKSTPDNIQKNCINFDMRLPSSVQGNLTVDVAYNTRNPEVLDLCLRAVDHMATYNRSETGMYNYWTTMEYVLHNPNNTEQHIESVDKLAHSGKFVKNMDSRGVFEKLGAIKSAKSTQNQSAVQHQQFPQKGGRE